MIGHLKRSQDDPSSKSETDAEIPKFPCHIKKLQLFVVVSLFRVDSLSRYEAEAPGLFGGGQTWTRSRVAAAGPPRGARAFPRPRCRHTWDASDRRPRNAGARRISGRRGGAALGPQLWGGKSRNLQPKRRAGRAALTAAALRPTRVGPKRQNQGFGDRMSLLCEVHPIRIHSFRGRATPTLRPPTQSDVGSAATKSVLRIWPG